MDPTTIALGFKVLELVVTGLNAGVDFTGRLQGSANLMQKLVSEGRALTAEERAEVDAEIDALSAAILSARPAG